MTLGSGNIGREGCGGVRTDGRQERYARPSDAHVGRPAAYVDPLLIGGQGGVHHIWACDDCKTTPNAMEFKRVHKKRTDTVKDAMTAVACPTGVQGTVVDAGTNWLILPNYQQTWGKTGREACRERGWQYV